MPRLPLSTRKPLWPYTLNESSPQANGLVGWWPGDAAVSVPSSGGSVRLFDLSKNHNNATFPAGAAWTPGVNGGKSALILNGSSQYAQGNSPAGLGYPTTLMCWAYLTSGAATATLFCVSTPPSNSNYIRLAYANAPSGMRAQVQGSVVNTSAETFVMSLNVWFHVVAVITSSNISIYGNGLLVNTLANSSGVVTAFGKTTIGMIAASSNVQFWPGSIEDCRIYNRALTAAEIQACYDLRTRWQLRWQPGIRTYFLASVPVPSQLRPPSQRIDPLPDYNYQWWQQPAFPRQRVLPQSTIIAHVQTIGVSDVSLSTVVINIPTVTPGNAIILGVANTGSNAATTTYTVRDSLGNSYDVVSNNVPAILPHLTVFLAKDINGGDAIITITPSVVGEITAAASEYSAGTGNTLAFDSTTIGSGGPNNATGALAGNALIANPELIYGICSTNGGGGTISGTGGAWAERYTSATGLINMEVQDIVNSSTNPSPSWTWSGVPSLNAFSNLHFYVTAATAPPLVLPATKQASQRIDPLPDFWMGGVYWQDPVQLSPVLASRILPIRPYQRIDPLPDYTYSWWEQFTKQPTPITFLVTPFPQQDDQRMYELPDYGFVSYQEQTTKQPVPITFLATPFPQPASQRIDPLPDYGFVVYQEQFTKQPIPITFLVTPFPPQHDQRIDPLPDYCHLWYHRVTLGQHVLPPTVTAPPTRQASQRIDPLPDYSHLWWQPVVTDIRLPIIPPPDNPPTRQASQRIDPLPDYWYGGSPWQPIVHRIPPSGFNPPVFGEFAFYYHFDTSVGSGGPGGSFRVQNQSLVGFNVYVGINQPPDFAQPPLVFQSTLPISAAVAPPGAGTENLYIVVRSQDWYGLESQNQQATIRTLTSAGAFLLSVLLPPQNSQVLLLGDNTVRVIGVYIAGLTDTNPATQWKVWMGPTTPNPNVDTPVATTVVTGTTLSVDVSSLTAGTYYVIVGLFRAADSALSVGSTLTIVIPAVPTQPNPVRSGHQI